jgi:hypothetical protein
MSLGIHDLGQPPANKLEGFAGVFPSLFHARPE